MAVIDSWVLQKKNNQNLTSDNYRSELAQTLCSYERYDRNKRGRRSNLAREIADKKTQRSHEATD